jgi:hypothetical protein
MQRWVKNHLFENDPVIVALDTIAYGGLISSRVGEDSLLVLEERVSQFFKMVRASSLFGFSSILRIPSYNNDEEEPSYWSEYGAKLYQYSYELHEAGKAAKTLEDSIPKTVLDDFLKRRKRNFALNESHLERLQEKQLDYLVFCQDDTGAYGLNVQEAHQLETAIEEKELSEKAHLQTGADEVACCLLARWYSQNHRRSLKIYPFYSSESGRQLVAKFDGLPIEAVVAKQIKACGAQLVKKPEDADIWLMVHTPEALQGDHCQNLKAQLSSNQYAMALQRLQKAYEMEKPVILADVAYANGSDPEFTEKFIQHFSDLSFLYGYAGWNTPGNTLGTALSMGVIRFLAEEKKKFNAKEFAKLLLIRLGDDWLYQSDVRYYIRKNTNGTGPSETLLNLSMANGLEMLQSRLGLGDLAVHCRFPCHRTFEIEIGIR